ncbi:MAG: YfhO family protein, partial [Oscillospiraceae bacterium]
SPSIMEFYPFVGEKRDVSSAPEHDNYALRGLLSVKYILVKQTSTNEYFEKVGTQDGYKAVKDVGSYTIVENENYLPMGFTYDYYLTESDFEDIPKSTRSNILMHTIMLSDEQSAKYGQLLQKLPDGKTHGFSYEQYLTDVADRKASSAREFK